MRKVVISGMIGNALEWYDYALYAHFVAIIGAHFFPDVATREFLTFAVFAAGFIIRPVGAVIFGAIGDRFGRRIALVIGILTMAIPTAGIGLLPSYDSIGIAAPILLVLIRLIQGFALGGEFSGCIAYIVEYSPHDKKGIAGSAAFVSMCGGMLLGTIVAQIFKTMLTPEELFNWGWRIPFVAGLFIGLIGLYIRSHLAESPVYHAAKQNGNLSPFPIKELFISYSRELLVAIALYVTVTAPFYTATVYMRKFMETVGYDSSTASFAGALILITMMIVLPLSAMLSDHVGRKPIMVSGTLLLGVLTPPLIGLLDYNDTILALTSVCAFAALSAYYMGPIPTVLVEMFPTRVRFTGVALSYNISAAIFGGTAPMVAVKLREITGDPYALTYYLSALTIITLIALYFYRETKNSRLSDITDAVSHE